MDNEQRKPGSGNEKEKPKTEARDDQEHNSQIAEKQKSRGLADKLKGMFTRKKRLLIVDWQNLLMEKWKR